MNTHLFIPSKIKVGYQERKGTYTGKLAYIIYYDAKGVLRKKTSWESWRSKNIEPEEFDNDPQEGFVINKEIVRYNWSGFGSNRTVIRIYDPRGIEFEVTPENLIGILMNSDCSKRGLTGKFVYAWHGKELVLLPCAAEEYDRAVGFTALQGKKVSAKSLVEGGTYLNKSGKVCVYLGRHNWWDNKYARIRSNTRYSDYYKYTRKATKKYIVAEEMEGGKFRIETKSSTAFLAECISDQCHPEFADLITQFQKNIESSKIVRWEFVERETGIDSVPFNAGSSYPHNSMPDNLHRYYVKGDFVYKECYGFSYRYGRNGYEFSELRIEGCVVYSNTNFEETPGMDEIRSYGEQKTFQNQQELDEYARTLRCSDLYAVLENGKKIKMQEHFYKAYN